MTNAKNRIIILAATLLSLLTIDSNACTNVLVTKGASADGSNMISYAADSHLLYGELYYLAGGRHNENDVRNIVEWDTNKPLGNIPQALHTYKRVGNINEHQLIIGETTYGGREELWSQDGAVLDYGSLIYIALERCTTAREAIKLIYDLTSEYGYASEGESFSIADKEEVWVMDLIGKGKYGKGIVFVARRVPDGYICAHANQARISTFPMDKPEECIYSRDVISFARERGYFNGEDSEFSFCDAYAPLDFGAMRGCEARAWSAFNILCDGVFTYIDENGNEVSRSSMSYIDYALGHDASKRFPLFVKPSRKLTVLDVASVMRDHYEGTPMDMTTDIGAGGNHCPYRWRPMTFTVDGQEYYNERAIATQQTGFWFVAQSRPALPDVVGALIWFGCDDAATSFLTPIYAATTSVPYCFKEGNGDMLTYSPTSAFWMCNRVANACYRAYDMMAPVVRKKANEWESSCLQSVKLWDAKAMEIYKETEHLRKRMRGGDPDLKIKEYLTDVSVFAADKIFKEWVKLEEMLLVGFIDGNVKKRNSDGSWMLSEYNLPVFPDQPGYSEKWKKAVVNDNGEILKVKK